MHSPKLRCVLLVLLSVAPGSLVFAQSAKPADGATPARSAAGDAGIVLAASAPTSTAAPDDSSSSSAPATRADVDTLQKEIDDLKKKAASTGAATSGWNGEHFFLKSSDGEFVMMPIGYLGEQYTYYGDNYGTPANTFAITRANFGVQGNYGKQLDYAVSFATNTSPGIRDAFLDFKPMPAFKVMVGLNKVPFSMEVGTADTAVEFFNRSIISVLYPDAGGTFRAPGIDFHGEPFGGMLEYWAGAFNGQGLLASGTTNEPELVGRLRFTPFKDSGITDLNKLSFGASIEHSRSKGINKEQSFSGLLNDSAYTFFPQFNINGNVLRYNAFFSWVDGPFGIRGEYAKLTQDRENIGTLATDGIAFNTQPAVKGSGFYLSGIYLLTGEDEPVNALPRVKHPVIGPNSPGESGGQGWGAWAVKFRYSRLQGNAYGATCDATTAPACPTTPSLVPSFSDTTVQYTGGVNWYLNYWVLAKAEINVDQLKDPSVGGIAPRNFTIFITSLQFRF